MNSFKKFGMCLLLLCSFPLLAEAQDVIRVWVRGDNVNIRSLPSIKGKIYRQADPEESFIVDSVTVKDKSDGSVWYKILFTTSPTTDTIYQTHKSSEYDYSYPYISARFVELDTLSENDQNQLDYLKRGRPVDIKIGEDLSSHREYFSPYVLKAPVTLYTEPNAGAATVALSAGTVVFEEDTSGSEPLMYYLDMDDTAWVYLLDEDNKLAGWIPQDDWWDYKK